MTRNWQWSRLSAVLLLLASCLATAFAEQPVTITAQLALDSAKIQAGQPIRGKVKAAIPEDAAKLKKAGVSLLICSGGVRAEDSALLSASLKGLTPDEAQKKLKKAVDDLGEQGKLVFHRQSPRAEVKGPGILELKLDEEGPIFPRSSSIDPRPLESGRFALIVFAVFSALDADEKEVVSYALAEEMMEVLPPSKKLELALAPKVLPSEADGKQVVHASYTCHGLSPNDFESIAFTLKVKEDTPPKGQPSASASYSWDEDVRGHFDFSPLELISGFSVRLPRPGSYKAVLQAVMPGSDPVESAFTLTQKGESVAVQAGAVTFPQIFISAPRVPRLVAAPLPREVSLEPKSRGEHAILSLRGYALGGVIEVDSPDADGFGFIRETPGLRLVGTGMKPGPDGMTRSGSLSWDLEVQPLLGLRPGIYTIPIDAIQDGAGESRVYLSVRTPLVRADASAGGGIMGTGIPGAGGASEIDIGTTRDPLGFFAARFEPDYLALVKGGASGSVRLFVQGVDPASDQPLEVIFTDLVEGKLPGGVVPTPSSFSQSISQLGTVLEDGRIVYVVDFALAANAQSSLGSYTYEVVIRQVGRGELVLTLEVDVVAGKSPPVVSVRPPRRAF